MRLKTKLLVGFSVLLVTMTAITSFGYTRLSQLKDQMNIFYENRFQKIVLVMDTRGQVNSAARTISDILLENEKPADGIQKITATLTDAAKQFDKLAHMTLTATEQQHIRRTQEEGAAYDEFLKTFVDDVNKGRLSDAAVLHRETGIQSQEAVIRAIDDLIAFEQKTMEEEVAQSKALYDDAVRMVATLTVLGIAFGALVILWVFPGLTRGLSVLERMADRLSRGKFKSLARMEVPMKDELGNVARLFQQVALDLQAKADLERELQASRQRKALIDGQLAKVPELLRKSSDPVCLARAFISSLAPEVGAAYGAIYLTDPLKSGGKLHFAGGYARDGDGERPGQQAFGLGEGLIGECALSRKRIVLDQVPPDYIKISSGLGEADPLQLLLQPICQGDETLGIVELASLTKFTDISLELANDVTEKFSAILSYVRSKQQTEELLRESQVQAEELQAQSEELIVQQDELRHANEKLEAQKEALEQQALQLALTSKYKSEFLANMSHELRTPLNSMLILSEFLAENQEGNLSDKQREYMRTIHLSGSELLKMIDDILDLSKVDAGKMEIQIDWTVVEDLLADLDHSYGPMVSKKGLELRLEAEDSVPQAIATDGHRVKQILRNLLSNAVKFTNAGSICLHISAFPEERAFRLGLEQETPYIAFTVTDTGIGIAPEKQKVIFEAFRQADGTTSRKYGGTGLGLTISRELARLLGGTIFLESASGKGSSFTLVLPDQAEQLKAWSEFGDGVMAAAAAADESSSATESEWMEAEAGSGSGSESESESEHDPLVVAAGMEGKRILLADDDVRNLFALSSVLEQAGMFVTVAENGEEALEMLRRYPDIDLVLLDMMMPDMDGYEALRYIRADSRWTHLPVIAVTARAMHDDREKCLEAGASEYVAKPIQAGRLLRMMRELLVR